MARGIRDVLTPFKIDDLRRESQVWRGKLGAVIAHIADMKAVVNEVRTAKQRAIGALMASRILYAIGIGMTAGVTWVFSNWIEISIR